jgi:uncharacterized phage protein (TIGR02218 family)
MKSASPALISLLNSGADFQMADLWTLTLSGGTVIRWSGADVPLVYNGNAYALGPAIDRGAISEKRGVDVQTLTMTIYANGSDTINGSPLIPFIANRGLDGANVRLDRAFLTDWNLPVVGAINRFAGKVTSIGEISGSSVQVTISSWLVLLNVNMPPELYQAGCLHTVYDAGCGLAASSFSATGTVAIGATQTSFSSNLTGHANIYAQGRIQFTSGANTGVIRAVKANDGAGNFTLIGPLPAAPANGDTFLATQGCDLTKATCQTKFANLARFKGTPFVPVPETSL